MPQYAPRQVGTPDNSDSSEYESDSGPVSVGVSSISQPTVSNGRMPQHEDMEIIWRLQLENQTLKNNNCALGETNKTLSANQWRSSSSTQIPDELKAFDAELATFSRKYGIIAEMFPPMHRILKLPVLKPPPAILSGSRYATKSAEELCLVTELYSLLPDHLHRFVPTSHFQSLQIDYWYITPQLGQHLKAAAQGVFSVLILPTSTPGLRSETRSPEIQKLLGQSSSMFPPVLFTRQEMDLTMSTVFGNWEPLAKAIRIVMFVKNSAGHCWVASAKCNARKWGITSCTPGLLAWGWVVLIFILSSDTSFTKDGVGARSRLPNYGSLLWEEPHIISIRQKINTHVWQSSTSNVAASEAEGKDFTSDLMRLALANAGHKDSDSPTINEDPAPPTTPTSPIIDTPVVIAPPVPPTVPAITPAMSPLDQATETIINPVPRSTTDQLPVSLTGNTNGEIMSQAVASGSSSSRQGRGKKAGVLAPVSLSTDTAEQQCGRPVRSRKKKQ
ncbi:uncharacterized protein F5147DRAFT_659072 [Suillus discolor]|uniref:Uncharacterized protein n=1 Tax=Suillus discolor TaxID=1912936 RepID=A0A9P7JLN6_9AGAM|nr:uncharacterized protein F5147DRAFT_659072 [Suillus discolor]KAG2086951.1 hypothetical protein F5147DRAFT_659072 [Suillus discolor]